MASAGQALMGTHDFRGFSEQCQLVENTVRTIHSLRVESHGDETWLTVRGTAFVRGMMRRVAGSLMEIGLGQREPDSLRQLLDPHTRDELTWPVVLPAQGLTLLRVHYHPRFRDLRLGDGPGKTENSIQESDE